MTDKLELTHPPTVAVGMLIRKPAAEVFEAFADPAVTTRFWFTKSTGRVEPGATVEWHWEMYGVSTEVLVHDAEPGRRIVFDWGPKEAQTRVEFRFHPAPGDATYVHVTETNTHGDGDRLLAWALDSTGGFTMVLCAAKALLEHGVELSVVGDKAPPKGVEL